MSAQACSSTFAFLPMVYVSWPTAMVVEFSASNVLELSPVDFLRLAWLLMAYLALRAVSGVMAATAVGVGDGRAGNGGGGPLLCSAPSPAGCTLALLLLLFCEEDILLLLLLSEVEEVCLSERWTQQRRRVVTTQPMLAVGHRWGMSCRRVDPFLHRVF